MNKFSRAVKALALAVPMSLAALSANAASVNTSGGTLDFSWSNLLSNGVTITGTGSMTTSLVNGNLVLAVTLSNTTTLLNSGDNTALVSFGFGISPNATSVTLNNTVDNGATGTDGDLNGAGMVTQQGNSNIPSLTGIEICAYGVPDPKGNCSGGDVNEGVQAGASDTFTLTLGGTWGDSVTIEPIGFKFQGTYGSYEFYSSSSSSTSSSSSSSTSGSGLTSGDTPEPGSASLALLGLGLLASGFMLRRRSLRG